MYSMVSLFYFTIDLVLLPCFITFRLIVVTDFLLLTMT